MSNELKDIILIIDTREQNQIRIKAVEDYFLQHGAFVEHSALKHCDYRLIGEFRDVSVNLGVEAKGWDNFLSDSIDEMEEKLLLATAEYDHVGFFVETQNYSFIPDENNKHGKLNYTIPRLNKSLPAKTLASMEGMFDTISKHPQIHVRQLRGEAQFPYSLYDLLVYLQKPHTLTVKPEGYVSSLQNLYMQIPQVGIERAKKLIQHYPNLFWLCSAAEPSLVEVMGQSMGTIIYQFLHNSELLTPEWMAGHHLDGTDKYKTICGQDCYNPQHCNALCERHPNNPKLKKQDDEGRLAFDAPAKNPVNASGARVEEQLACNEKVAGSTPASGLKCTRVWRECNFADPKKKAECKTPDHFKSSEHIAIMAAIEGYLSGFSEGRTANEICDHFNILSGDPDKEQMLKHIKQLAWEGRITSDGQLFKIIPSHVPGSIPLGGSGTDTLQSLSNGQTVCSPSRKGGTKPKRSDKCNSAVTRDTSSHPEAASFEHTTPISASGDNILGVPPIVSTNDGSGDTSYLDEKTKCVVKCRACHQVIIPENDDDTGFCHNPECIEERAKPKQKMNLKETIKDFMADGKPHLLQDIVNRCEGWTPKYIFDHVMGAVKSGYFKKITEQDGRVITFQRIE